MTMNKIIVAMFFTVLAFIVTVLVYNYHSLQVQDSLINGFYVLMGAELTAMGGIKITKTVKNHKTKVDKEESL